jgi:disulfide bond formation protein DsbB
MNVYLYQYLLATGVLTLHVIIALLIIILIIKPQSKIIQHIKKNGLGYSLFISIMAFVGSLGFSEGFNYEPCTLCWVQRIFHYPQIVLFALAFKLKDPKVWIYSVWLSIIGFVIALYQVLIQFSPRLAASSICNINPSTVSCSDILSQSFGYITIPVMSLTVFALLILLYVIQKNKKA